MSCLYIDTGHIQVISKINTGQIGLCLTVRYWQDASNPAGIYLLAVKHKANQMLRKEESVTEIVN